MIDLLVEALIVLKMGFGEFINTDFGPVRYENLETVKLIGTVLAVVLCGKIVWQFFRKHKFSQKQSGHLELIQIRQNPISKLFRLAPLVLMILSMVLLLGALANPFLDQRSEKVEVKKSRIRIELRDTSTSMLELFWGTKKTKAEVAAEAHLEFLKMRKGKNDRVSFWLFASNPYLVQNFLIDDELYFQEVEDAPWVSVDSRVVVNIQSLVFPEDRYNRVEGENGGTDLSLALSAIISQLNKDKESNKTENNKLIKKSLLIITDGEPNNQPDEKLQELKNRNVMIYVLFIRSVSSSSDDDGGDSQFPPLPLFIQNISKFGGIYFDVRDKNSLTRAYKEIDKIETVKVNNLITVFKKFLFENFILAAIFIAIIAIVLGLIIEPFGVYP